MNNINVLFQCLILRKSVVTRQTLIWFIPVMNMCDYLSPLLCITETFLHSRQVWFFSFMNCFHVFLSHLLFLQSSMGTKNIYLNVLFHDCVKYAISKFSLELARFFLDPKFFTHFKRCQSWMFMYFEIISNSQNFLAQFNFGYFFPM